MVEPQASHGEEPSELESEGSSVLRGGDEYVEDINPEAGLQTYPVVETPTDVVRRKITYSLLGLVLLNLVFGWVLLATRRVSASEMQDMFPLLAGQLITVLGTVLGFYFGSSRDRK